MKTTSTEPTKLIFLGMSSKAAATVLAARPELQSLKPEVKAHYVRKLGDAGDPEVKKASQDDFIDAIVVGFNIPVNIATAARKVIEIPVDGKVIDRKILGNALDEQGLAQLSKALGNYANMPLKAVFASTGPIALKNEEEETDLKF